MKLTDDKIIEALSHGKTIFALDEPDGKIGADGSVLVRYPTAVYAILDLIDLKKDNWEIAE